MIATLVSSFRRHANIRILARGRLVTGALLDPRPDMG
jgi:hypothetical protein